MSELRTVREKTSTIPSSPSGRKIGVPLANKKVILRGKPTMSTNNSNRAESTAICVSHQKTENPYIMNFCVVELPQATFVGFRKSRFCRRRSKYHTILRVPCSSSFQGFLSKNTIKRLEKLMRLIYGPNDSSGILKQRWHRSEALSE